MATTDGAAPGATTRYRNITKPTSIPADIGNVPADMDIGTPAFAFWVTHARPLSEAGLLAETEIYQFRELCDLYALLQVAKAKVMATGEGFKTYLDTLAKFTSLSAKFLLFPSERRKQSIAFQDNADRHQEMKGFQWGQT